MKKASNDQDRKVDAIKQFATIEPDLRVAPRAEGAVSLSTKRCGHHSVIDRFRQAGSFKCLFPRKTDTGLDAVLLNTAGGVTGGDRFQFIGAVAADTVLNLTTQACERVYKAQPEQTGMIRNTLTVDTGARLNWLPQETILFDGGAIDRKLAVDLAPGATALLVEPIVFGRPAMGEILTDIRLRDRVEIRRSGELAFLDAWTFSGDLHAHLARASLANGAGAMALVVFASDKAQGCLAPIRDLLPGTGGASLVQDDLLVIRLLADNSFALRRDLLPILRRLNNDTLPRCWML